MAVKRKKKRKKNGQRSHFLCFEYVHVRVYMCIHKLTEKNTLVHMMYKSMYRQIQMLYFLCSHVPPPRGSRLVISSTSFRTTLAQGCTRAYDIECQNLDASCSPFTGKFISISLVLTVFFFFFFLSSFLLSHLLTPSKHGCSGERPRDRDLPLGSSRLYVAVTYGRESLGHLSPKCQDALH